jgi:hypothetical protein
VAHHTRMSHSYRIICHVHFFCHVASLSVRIYDFVSKPDDLPHTRPLPSAARSGSERAKTRLRRSLSLQEKSTLAATTVTSTRIACAGRMPTLPSHPRRRAGRFVSDRGPRVSAKIPSGFVPAHAVANQAVPHLPKVDSMPESRRTRSACPRAE